MAKKTMAQRFQEALEARGWAVDSDHRTGKYVAMKPVRPEAFDLIRTSSRLSTARLFIGKAGALRGSTSGRASSSSPMSDKFKSKLLGEG